MSDDGRVDATLRLGDLVLNDDRASVRFHLPPLPIDGLAEPLRVYLNFDAGMVEVLLERLTALHDQMKQPSAKSRSRVQPH